MAESSRKAKAHAVFIRLVLPPYTIHFKSPTYLQPRTLDLLDKKVCKETLKTSAQDVNVREAIGTDSKYWADLVVLLRAAIPSLERRSFTIWDHTSVDYESTSSALIAGSHPGLWLDLERLNDIISISRNILTIGVAAQDLAAQHGVDTEIFRIINCCVRVTARGFDGDAGTGEEEKWQWVVNAYKKLLITSLQFLNNLAAQNEKRKLMLWVSLFDNSAEVAAQQSEQERQAARDGVLLSRPEPPTNRDDLLLAYGSDGTTRLSPLEIEAAIPLEAKHGFRPFPKEAEADMEKMRPSGYVYWAKRARDLVIKDFQLLHRRSPTLSEIHLNLPRYWRIGSQYWETQNQIYGEALAKYRHELAAYEVQERSKSRSSSRTPITGGADPFQQQINMVEQKLKHLEALLVERHRTESVAAPDFEPPVPTVEGIDYIPEPRPSPSQPTDDTRMLFTAEAGAKILESGKAELMKRLEGYEASSPGSDAALPPSRNPDGMNTRQVRTTAGQTVEKTRSMSRSPPGYHGESDELRVAGRRMPDTRVRWRRPSDEENQYVEDSLDEEEDEEEEEDESDEVDEDEEDYPGSSEDGRGLLTDVPLILGPSEIEVLPMIIMSGVVPRLGPDQLHSKDRDIIEAREHPSNTATLLTHLLLSQTSGRNLLRELLIFVAAWDLREEELYFKFMVKIMEAILTNGLMPYAYHAFRDRSRSKDIISPAQAVIMKLLTCIFRGRGDAAKGATVGTAERQQATAAASLSYSVPSEKVDLHILNFIFTEFRQHIIPQTCALIFLQGQIHKGRASPEDFPLNLWDMERMYEGVYQYLEFFAVLTEDQSAHAARQRDTNGTSANVTSVVHGGNSSWKAILAEWEMASELVTLLRELEDGIPKLLLQPNSRSQQLAPIQQSPLPPARTDTSSQIVPTPVIPQTKRSISADAAIGRMPTPSSTPIAVERPFDLDSPPPHPPLPPIPSHNAAGEKTGAIFEPEAPLAYPEESSVGLSSAVVPPLPSHDLQQEQDEPSDFEWRNLKKLTVLVLSSLLWKSKAVQDQVRKYGGLTALLGCCKKDEHNPYIREHAIMCLRFAIEGNEENKTILQGMADRDPQMRLRQNCANTEFPDLEALNLRIMENVPREVLDTNGYETFMDSKGQVGLRRKDPPPSSVQVSNAAFSPSTPLAPPVQGPALPPPPPPPASTLAAAASSALSALQYDLGLLSSATNAAATSSSRHNTHVAAQLNRLTAEAAADIMQTALRELPLGDRMVTDRQKAEALARLDRAFESTEQALGKGIGERGRKG